MSQTWIINANPEGPKLNSTAALFTSNNQRFNSLRFLNAPDGWELEYYPVSGSTLYVYATDPSIEERTTQWLDQAYRTVVFDEAPTGALLTWLQANAVVQTAPKIKSIKVGSGDRIDIIPEALGNGNYKAICPTLSANIGIEVLTNKTTSISSSSTNNQYPTAKAVFKSLKSKYAGFTFYEYIQIDGNQWINTGVMGPAKWVYDIQYLNTTKRQLMGHGGTGGEYWGVTDGVYGMGTWSKSSVAIGNRDTFQVNNFSGTQSAGIGGYRYVNGIQVLNEGYDSRSEGSQAQLFTIYSSDGYSAICKLWSCQVYDINNNLIRLFVAAKRTSDNMPGLLDLKQGVFYTSAGYNNNFTLGPEI